MAGADDKPMDALKKDLVLLLYRIIDQEDFESSAADDIIEKLNALKISKMGHASSPPPSRSSGSATPVVPDQFRCPISGVLMKDPVLLKTGQTYDRPCIERWFHKGHNTCPRTKEVLSDMTLTPNRLLRSMISQWCLDNKLDIPKLTYEAATMKATESHLEELLNQLLSPSLLDQKEAAKELRHIARWDHEFRALFAKLPESIERLLHPVSVDNVSRHPDLQEDLITTVLNISIHEDNKKHVAENPLVLPLLIQSLQYGSMEAKANAAAAIFSLSVHKSNKIAIGNMGALKPLISLLDEGHPVVIRDAASAIFNLCSVVENKQKAVACGAVSSVVHNISHGVLVDELVSVLALLSMDLKAIDEMCKLNTVSCLLRIMRENKSQGVKQNCASILYLICMMNRSKLKEIRDDEDANGTILELSRTGNARARRKAESILNRLQRAASITHTA